MSSPNKESDLNSSVFHRVLRSRVLKGMSNAAANITGSTPKIFRQQSMSPVSTNSSPDTISTGLPNSSSHKGRSTNRANSTTVPNAGHNLFATPPREIEMSTIQHITTPTGDLNQTESNSQLVNETVIPVTNVDSQLPQNPPTVTVPAQIHQPPEPQDVVPEPHTTTPNILGTTVITDAVMRELGRQLLQSNPDDNICLEIEDRYRELLAREATIEESAKQLALQQAQLADQQAELSRQIASQNNVLGATDNSLEPLRNQLNNIQLTVENFIRDQTERSLSQTPTPQSSTSNTPISVPLVTRTSLGITSSITTTQSIVTTSITNSIPSVSTPIPQSANNRETQLFRIYNALHEVFNPTSTPDQAISQNNPVGPPGNCTNTLSALRNIAPNGIYNGSAARPYPQTSRPLTIPHQLAGISSLHEPSPNLFPNSSHPQERRNLSSDSTFNNSIAQDLTNLLSSRLPSIEIDKFQGEVKNYESFKTKFQTLISGTDTTEEQRARTLYQALGNDVVCQLDHIPNLAKPGAYERLWENLDTEYGRYLNGATSYVTELITKLQLWPPCRTSSEIHHLYKFVRYIYTALEQTNQISEIEHSSVRVLILGRLTGGLLGKCSKLIDRNPNDLVIKRILDEMRDEVRTLSLQEMAKGQKVKPFSKSNFIDANGISQPYDPNLINVNNVGASDTRSESRVRFKEPPSSPSQGRYNDANRSPNRFRPPYNDNRSPIRYRPPYNDNNQRSPSRSWNNNQFTPTYNAGTPPRRYDPNWSQERDQRFGKRCFFCYGDDHDPDDCRRLSHTDDYKAILYRFNLCFNCLHQLHSSSRCLYPKKCTKNCSDMQKHSSVICSKQD